MCVYLFGMCVCMQVRGQLLGALSFHHVVSKDDTQVVRPKDRAFTD